MSEAPRSTHVPESGPSVEPERFDEPVFVETPPSGTPSPRVPGPANPKIRRDANVYRTGRRWSRRAAQGFLAFLGVVVVLGAVVFGYAEYRLHQIQVVGDTGVTPVAVDQPMNILMVGNNSRCALNGKQANAFGSCGDNGGTQVAGGRSDVIMILHLDPATRGASVLSIPRDMVAPVPGYRNEMKIDSALDFGPKVLVSAIEADFGITINHFVELNFDSFQGVVSALGGLDMYFPQPVYDGLSGLNVNPAACGSPSADCSKLYDPNTNRYETHVLQTGCLHLDGFQTLAEVRARHLWYYKKGSWSYDGGGDLSRIRRNHEFLKVLASQVQSRGLANPIVDNSIISSVAPQLEVDPGLRSVSTMLGLLERYHSAHVGSMAEYTLPVVETSGDYVVNGQAIGNVVFPSEPFDQNAIDHWLGLPGPPAESVSPSGVSVQVVNASGSQGLGTRVEQQLSQAGFTVSDGGSVPPAGSPAETLVVYKGPAALPAAERVAENFSGAVMLEKASTPPGVDVVVDVTSNAVFNSLSSGGPASAGYTVVSPAANATVSSGRHPPGGISASTSASSTSVASSSTSAVSTTPTTSPIGVATNSQNPLQPWDPRSCPAGMKAVPALFNG